MAGVQTACLRVNGTPSPLRPNLDDLLAFLCHYVYVTVSIYNTQLCMRVIQQSEKEHG